MEIIALYGICLVVGFLVGGTGMGGILIPPALVLLSGLETHCAMGTTLASFIPMNIAGIYLYRRMGHLPWDKSLPLLIGGTLSAGPCAFFNVGVNAVVLNALLALLVLFAGFCAVRPPSARKDTRTSFWQRNMGLFIIGFATGTAAGLTGAGGPLLAIAWMVTCSIHPVTAVGLSMPYSLATALAASFSNYLNGNIDLPFLARIASLEFLAFLFGVFCVRSMPVIWIRRLMGVTCWILGLFLLMKSLVWGF